MAVKFNKNSANKDYNDLLKELGVINNNNDEKKNVKWIFKTKMINQNKYQIIDSDGVLIEK